MNTWKNEGDYDLRLRLIAQAFAELQPDIILLQECFICHETGDNTLAYLERQLGLKSAFARAREKPRWHRGSQRRSVSGLAILARGAFEASKAVALPSSERGGERVVLSADLAVGGTAFRAVCSHFSHIREEVEIRTSQIVAAFGEATGSEEADIALVGGDFNCEPGGKEVGDAFARAGASFANALSEAGCQAPTFPLPPREGGDGRQIDQIWLRFSESGRWKLRDAGVALNRPSGESDLYPSDHAAVWVDVEEA